MKGVLSKSDIPLLSKSEKVVIENREIERESNHQTKKTSDVQEFIKFYFEEYRKKFKTDPPFKGGRDGQTVKTLLKMMTLDILKINISRYLETEDLFFRKNGYDIPRFEKFLDGIKCGAYEAGESCVPASNASQDDVLLDPATGNPLQTARHIHRKSVQQRFKENSDPDEEVIYDAAGLPVKTLTSSIHRPSARDIVRKEFGSADLLLKGDEVKISPRKNRKKVITPLTLPDEIMENPLIASWGFSMTNIRPEGKCPVCFGSFKFDKRRGLSVLPILPHLKDTQSGHSTRERESQGEQPLTARQSGRWLMRLFS